MPAITSRLAKVCRKQCQLKFGMPARLHSVRTNAQAGLGRRSWARGIVERLLGAVFEKAKVPGAHAHHFRHTFNTDSLARGGSMTDVADVLGISEHVARKHCAKWSPARQERISSFMRAVYSGISGGHEEKQGSNSMKSKERMVVRKEGFEPSCPRGAADFESAASAVPPLPQASRQGT